MNGMANALSRDGPGKQDPIKPDSFTEVVSLRETNGTAH
jgi:hypothetical protein